MARLPDAYRVAGVRHEGSSLVLDLVIDTEPFVRAIRALAEAIERTRPVLERFAWAMSGTANSERVVCGQEARLYVRAGLDRGYHSPEAMQALTRSILDGSESPVVSMMSRPNRARLVASALRGWAEHQMDDEPTRPVIWHRYLAGTRVVVTTSEGA